MPQEKAQTHRIPDFLAPLPKTTMDIQLPSRGVLYAHGPAKTGKLTLSPMTLVEEGLVTSAMFGEAAGGVDVVLRRCVQDNIDLQHLLSSDKYFLFMMLRAVTYGPEYRFGWTCNALHRSGPLRGTLCDHRMTSTVNIPNDFSLKQLSDDDTEPFAVDLPESGKRLEFRLMRSHDEDAVDKYRREAAQKPSEGVQQQHSEEAFRLARLVFAVDGNEVSAHSPKIVYQWILSLPPKDIALYKARLAYYTPGIDTTVKTSCDQCGSLHEFDLPMTLEFFRPELPGDGRPEGNEVQPDVPPEAGVERDAPDPAGGAAMVLQEIAAGEGGGGAGRDRDREGEAPGTDAGGGHDGGAQGASPGPQAVGQG